MTHREPRESSWAARAQHAWVFGELHSTAVTAVIGIASTRGGSGSVRLWVGCVQTDGPGMFVLCLCLTAAAAYWEGGFREIEGPRRAHAPLCRFECVVIII